MNTTTTEETGTQPAVNPDMLVNGREIRSLTREERVTAMKEVSPQDPRWFQLVYGGTMAPQD